MKQEKKALEFVDELFYLDLIGYEYSNFKSPIKIVVPVIKNIGTAWIEEDESIFVEKDGKRYSKGMIDGKEAYLFVDYVE